ncbi:L,D-transpeptidase [Romeria aff. gracilis LEGE 07310]|uniref:L,D-transpeptidase n=1 Tax=Vasconcelosia minhoensis LEGE 07310 TaxID=915328 RepID=A0A8J7AIA6_9CYAN|nr:L,D-transpeptidase [Romeria gracilis]MBE9079484.1 L,D-transpeptidase [Romeria aff. gracilis LEGE 07310]
MVTNSKTAALCLSGLLLSGLSGLLPGTATAQSAAPTESASGDTDSLRVQGFAIETKVPLHKPAILQPAPLPTPDTAPEPVATPDLPEEAPIRLVLRINARRVYAYRGEAVVASYPVAVGKPGWETPTGEYEVFSTIVEPGWTNPFTGEVAPPGPSNPLGERWIGFWTDGENVIGFHGTPNRESIGRAASHGCVRMYNEDIRELYEIVEMGTPVTVLL